MVYILLGNGFEEIEAIAPLDLLRRAGVDVLTVGINGRQIVGGHNIVVEADIVLDEMNLTDLEMIVLPGGLGGVESIRNSGAALDAVRFAWENKKYVAAICAGPMILAEMGITENHRVVCYPSCENAMGNATVLTDVPSVQDDMLITGTSAGGAIPFGLSLIAALRGNETANAIRNQIVIR